VSQLNQFEDDDVGKFYIKFNAYKSYSRLAMRSKITIFLIFPCFNNKIGIMLIGLAYSDVIVRKSAILQINEIVIKTSFVTVKDVRLQGKPASTSL